MPIIKIDDVAEINFIRTGPRHGRPVILLHPLGLDLTWWAAQVEDFGRDHDVIAFDLPGHGLSEQLAAPPSFALMASVVEGLLAQLNSGPVHVVGISVGGMIAQAFALRRPDLVSSLSLVATLCAFPAPIREALRQRAKTARAEGMAKIAQLSNERWFTPSFRARRPDMIDRAAKSLMLQNPEFHASMWDMIAGLDMEAQLPSITCPTLVVAGTEDVNAPVAAGARITDLISGAALHEMAGVAHFPPFEAPVEFNARLRSFLTETGSAA